MPNYPLRHVIRSISARLMAQIPKEESEVVRDGPAVKGGAFGETGEQEKESPFGRGIGEGVDAGRGETEWVVSQQRYKFDEVFHDLNPIDGKLTGQSLAYSCFTSVD